MEVSVDVCLSAGPHPPQVGKNHPGEFQGKHQVTKTSISIIIVAFQEMRLGSLPLRTTAGWIWLCRCPDRRMCAGRPGRTARLCRRRRVADTCAGSSTIGRPGGSWWSPLFFEARSLAITVGCGARSRKPGPSRLNNYLVTTAASSARISSRSLPRSHSAKNRTRVHTHALRVAPHRTHLARMHRTRELRRDRVRQHPLND